MTYGKGGLLSRSYTDNYEEYIPYAFAIPADFTPSSHRIGQQSQEKNWRPIHQVPGQRVAGDESNAGYTLKLYANKAIENT